MVSGLVEARLQFSIGEKPSSGNTVQDFHTEKKNMEFGTTPDRSKKVSRNAQCTSISGRWRGGTLSNNAKILQVVATTAIARSHWPRPLFSY